MAEFSKQYIEAYMPGWSWDFDLEDEFRKIEPGEYMALICEGFGFIGIQKQLDGSKFFLYKDKDGKIVEIPYDYADEATFTYLKFGKNLSFDENGCVKYPEDEE